MQTPAGEFTAREAADEHGPVASESGWRKEGGHVPSAQGNISSGNGRGQQLKHLMEENRRTHVGFILGTG